MSILFLTIFLANHESAFARGYSESLREQAAGQVDTRLRQAALGYGEAGELTRTERRRARESRE